MISFLYVLPLEEALAVLGHVSRDERIPPLVRSIVGRRGDVYGAFLENHPDFEPKPSKDLGYSSPVVQLLPFSRERLVK